MAPAVDRDRGGAVDDTQGTASKRDRSESLEADAGNTTSQGAEKRIAVREESTEAREFSNPRGSQQSQGGGVSGSHESGVPDDALRGKTADDFPEEGPFPSMVDEDADVADRQVDPTLLAVLSSAESGDLSGLNAALRDLECSVDSLGPDGDTALHLACLYGHFSCAEALLKAGANAMAKDEDGALPLHDACASGFPDIARMLLESCSASTSGAMVNAQDDDGDTPLHNAARSGSKPVAEVLLEFGAKLQMKNLSGQTPNVLCKDAPHVWELLENQA